MAFIFFLLEKGWIMKSLNCKLTSIRSQCFVIYSINIRFLVLNLYYSYWCQKFGVCALILNRISETVLDEVKKNTFIALPGKGGHNRLVTLKNMCPNLGGFADKIRVCMGACTPLIWSQVMISWRASLVP